MFETVFGKILRGERVKDQAFLYINLLPKREFD